MGAHICGCTYMWLHIYVVAHICGCTYMCTYMSRRAIGLFCMSFPTYIHLLFLIHLRLLQWFANPLTSGADITEAWSGSLQEETRPSVYCLNLPFSQLWERASWKNNSGASKDWLTKYSKFVFDISSKSAQFVPSRNKRSRDSEAASRDIERSSSTNLPRLMRPPRLGTKWADLLERSNTHLPYLVN